MALLLFRLLAVLVGPGKTKAIMGNHELNALYFHTLRPDDGHHKGFQMTLGQAAHSLISLPNASRGNAQVDERLFQRMAFYRLKNWRCIATRYDKLAINFEAAIVIAAVLLWWT